ncbi:MAG: fibrobacter succinogenes major paralogous domain-containing protein [Chitinophagales bacterium]
MNTRYFFLLTFFFLAIIIQGCKKDDDNDNDDQHNLPQVEITDANSLSANLTLDGAIRKSGDIPEPSGGGTYGKNLEVLTPEIVLSPDDYKMELSIESDGVAKIIYLQIDGADEHFEITIDANGNSVFKNSNLAANARTDRTICMCVPDGQCNGGFIATPYVPQELVAPATVQIYEPPLQGNVPDLSHLMNIGSWSAKRPIVIRVKKEDNNTGGGGSCGSTVSDIDGNVYEVVKIGSQCWMAENLNTSKYNDGSPIQNVTDGYDWINQTSGAWVYYDNDNSYEDTYGKLYNWHAVNTGKLCPSGWHIPTNLEWNELIDHLGGSGVAGGKMKSTSSLWESPNTGAGNESGFAGLPGGYRDGASYNNGEFYSININTAWWSSSAQGNTDPRGWFFQLKYTHESILSNYFFNEGGNSCRCVKD